MIGIDLFFNHSLSTENWSASAGGFVLGNSSDVLYLDLYMPVFPPSVFPDSVLPSDFTTKQ